MNMCVYEKTKENTAKALGIAKFSDVSKFSEEERKSMINKARKQLKIKSRIRTKDFSSGNPYVMLGRKVNSKGKLIK